MTKKLSIVMVAPRIPLNVGAVARTAMGLSASLHVVGPFGFFWDNQSLKRTSAGYWPQADVKIYKDEIEFWTQFDRNEETEFYWATKFGEKRYSEIEFGREVVLLFGNEEVGIPQNFWNYKALPKIVSCRIPMVQVRCLNLATCVGIIGYEVGRQWGFPWESGKGGELSMPDRSESVPSSIENA